MKYKILPLMILLTLLSTLTVYTQTPPQSQPALNNDYGIEPGKNYPGTLLLELLEIAEEEIDAAVSKAFAEGYKSAMVQYAPQAQSYKNLAENLQKDLAAEQKKNRYFWPILGVSVGVSFGAGFMLCYLIGR